MTWLPLSDIDWITTDNPFDSEPEFARLIGLVVERWSLLEKRLAGTLACLLDGNKTAAEVIFYTVVSNKTRLDIIEALAKKLVPDGPEKDGVLKLLDRADRLNKSRNNIIHGEYHTGMNGLDRLSIRPLAKETRQWTPIGVSEITQHLQAVEKLELAFSFATASDTGHWVYRRPSPRRYP